MKSLFLSPKSYILIVALNALFLQSCSSNQTPVKQQGIELNASEQLGKALFFDTRLSSPEGQSCASCHSPQHGFSQPDNKLATSEGATKGLFGNRNTPSISYIKFTPKFHKVTEEGETLYVGGFFLDGRESTLEELAIKPILNPLEMGIKDTAELVQKVIDAGYKQQFEAVFGKKALDNTHIAGRYIAQSLADYQRSKELSPFSSKYDAYLAGKAKLSKQELDGLKLFDAEDKGNCAACHPSKIDKASGFPPLFTDFTYDNLGIPANPNNPFLKNPTAHNPHGTGYRDRGLGEFINDDNQNGKFKVPTLRNIALTAPYMHNGVLSTLKETVSFYNTRDTDKKWEAPEIKENVNKDELGDLKLSDDEVDAIVAFLRTLTDGYKIEQ